MPYKEIPQEKIIEAYNKSETIKDLIINVGLFPAGTNYTRLRKECQKLNLDLSKFNKRKYYTRYSSTKEMLVSNKDVSSVALKRRLIKEKYFEHKCYKCNLTEWNEQPIAIELEHINGNKLDNRIENLTILCPNCHAQTDTYRGKNAKKKFPKNSRRVGPITYPQIREEVKNLLENNKDFIKEYATTIPLIDISKQIGTTLVNVRAYCKYYNISTAKKQKIKDFTKEEIQTLLSQHSLLRTAKILGCSDNGLRKKCDRLGINYKV